MTALAMASPRTRRRSIARDRSRFYKSAQMTTRAALVPLGEAEPQLAPIYERVAKQTPGMFTRTSDWWQARTLADPQWRRGNAGELQCAVL